MKLRVFLPLLPILAAGCGEDRGNPIPPPRPAPTQAQIDAAPPQARGAMMRAQRQGAAQAARYQNVHRANR